MQRKVLLFPVVLATAVFTACSDEPTGTNPIDPYASIQDSKIGRAHI